MLFFLPQSGVRSAKVDDLDRRVRDVETGPVLDLSTLHFPVVVEPMVASVGRYRDLPRKCGDVIP